MPKRGNRGPAARASATDISKYVSNCIGLLLHCGVLYEVEFMRSAAGVSSDNASGTIRNLSGKGPIGSPSTCAKTGFAPADSHRTSLAFHILIPFMPRIFPSQSAGKHAKYCKRLRVEFVRNSNESSNNVAFVVILNGPP